MQAQWNAETESTTQRCKGHGRIEGRTLTTTTWLNEYLRDWPGVQQVFRLERTRTQKGKVSTEVVYGITSLHRGHAARVLASLRNVAIHLLRTKKHPSVPAATRHLAAQPRLALDRLNSQTSISE